MSRRKNRHPYWLAPGNLDHGDDADGSSDSGDDKGDIFYLQVIEIGFFDEVQVPDPLHGAEVVEHIEHHFRTGESGIKVEEDTEGEGDGKAFDRTGTEHEKGDGGYQGCDLGIHNGQKGLVKSAVDA